jgi:hypothetical protein
MKQHMNQSVERRREKQNLAVKLAEVNNRSPCMQAYVRGRRQSRGLVGGVDEAAGNELGVV